jgi:ribosome-associated heat shock protein Hsp15
MMAAPSAPSPNAMRLDRLLVYLRFAKTRSAACALIDSHAVRRNRKPVLRSHEAASIGDVLTLALGRQVKVVEVLSLPERRGSPAEAQRHYREIDITKLDTGNLDPIGQSVLAAPDSERD